MKELNSCGKKISYFTLILQLNEINGKKGKGKRELTSCSSTTIGKAFTSVRLPGKILDGGRPSELWAPWGQSAL